MNNSWPRDMVEKVFMVCEWKMSSAQEVTRNMGYLRFWAGNKEKTTAKIFWDQGNKFVIN